MAKAIALIAALFTLNMGVALASTADTNSTPTPRFMRVACAQEDSSNCYWNAGESGNGEGHSFFSIRVGDKDCIRYWDAKFNRKHGFCVKH